MATPFVSIVIPVYNSELIIKKCLESLKRLDYSSDRYEIIIADSLSTDRTREIAGDFGVKVVTTPQRSVCAGRNAGFKVAKGELIAFSDADCVMEKDWLKNAVKYFDDEKVGGVGGPNLVPRDDSLFSHAVDILFAYAHHIVNACHVRVMDRVIESPCFGSNIILRKKVLDKVMPVPEDHIEGEDIVMNKRITISGYKMLYVPDVVVWHERRSTPRSWFKQMYAYGIGRLLAGKRHPSVFHYMHILCGASLPLVLFAIVYGIIAWPHLLHIVTGLAILLAVGSFFFALWDKRDIRIALLFPLVIYLALLGWSAGFLRAAVYQVRK